MPQSISRRALRGLIGRVMRRGVPRSDAEDIVLHAYEKAAPVHDPARGSLESLLHRTVDRDTVDWWRRNRAWSKVAQRLSAQADVVQLHVVDPAAQRRAHGHQQALLERLSPQERKVFAAWALQRHLPQGELTASRAAATLGVSVPEYNNAKKRLARRVRVVLDELGLTPRDLWTVAEDEGPRRHHA